MLYCYVTTLLCLDGLFAALSVVTIRELTIPYIADKCILAFNRIAQSNLKYKNGLRILMAVVEENEKNANKKYTKPCCRTCLDDLPVIAIPRLVAKYGQLINRYAVAIDINILMNFFFL